jgi:hypothetical protein
VTSEFHIFVCHRSSAFLWVIYLVVFTTQLTATLYAESLVSCNNCVSLFICFNEWSEPGRSLFRPESVTSPVENYRPKL